MMLGLQREHYLKILLIVLMLAVISFTAGGVPERYVYGGF
jgi:hypothetical protein